MNGIDALTNRVPPPAAPHEPADPEAWAAAEAALGASLPPNLYAVAAVYGSGWFRPAEGHALWLANPCSRAFTRYVRDTQATYADLRAAGGHALFPADLYPSDPGLLCVGGGPSPTALFVPLRSGKPGDGAVALTFQGQWVRDPAGLVPLVVAALRGRVDLFGNPAPSDQTIWRFDPDHPPDQSSGGALVEAAVLGDDGRVGALVRGGADPNRPAADGPTPLCSVEDEAMVRLLLSLGADPNQRDGTGRTPLTVACSSGLPIGGLQALLDAGADPNRPAGSGAIPLVLASEYRGPDEVRLLLRAGADPKRADGYGRTPLRAARKRPDVQAVLRAAGAE